MRTKQNTFILFWNPDVSSYKLKRFEDDLALGMTREECGFNWSVWEHEKAHAGDAFFMVRCKKAPVEGKFHPDGKQVWEPVFDNNCGICMYGQFTTEPYEDEDWSGKGRQTFYMDMRLDMAIHPDNHDIVTVAELMDKIPGFDWTGGHSGRQLDDDKAAVLKKMVSEWMLMNTDVFVDGGDADYSYSMSIDDVAAEILK